MLVPEESQAYPSLLIVHRLDETGGRPYRAFPEDTGHRMIEGVKVVRIESNNSCDWTACWCH
jgi:hypothetical protein